MLVVCDNRQSSSRLQRPVRRRKELRRQHMLAITQTPSGSILTGAATAATPTIIILMRGLWMVNENCTKAPCTYFCSYFVDISAQHCKICQVAEDAIQKGMVDPIGA